MSHIRFKTSGESRWWAAYVRYLAQQREHEPTGSRRPDDVYGYISPERKTVLREDAKQVVDDLIANNLQYPETHTHRMEK